LSETSSSEVSSVGNSYFRIVPSVMSTMTGDSCESAATNFKLTSARVIHFSIVVRAADHYSVHLLIGWVHLCHHELSIESNLLLLFAGDQIPQYT
jgi:hypothetical protein